MSAPRGPIYESIREQQRQRVLDEWNSPRRRRLRAVRRVLLYLTAPIWAVPVACYRIAIGAGHLLAWLIAGDPEP